ncbi:MAG TPA: hypothetical protein VK738_10475 [Terriglobales bacterium]|jgi:hypothetical protein|nr:hypothetical protein [Terriglobales bacterium]
MRRYSFMLLCFVVLTTCLPTQAQKIAAAKAAKGSGDMAPNHIVKVDMPFTDQMADQAGLDKNKPQLSSDGVQGSGGLASTECLLAETIANETFDNRDHDQTIKDKDIERFCEKAVASDTQGMRETVRSALDEHTSTELNAPIEDVVIHLVRWDDAASPQGAWYHYHRSEGGWSGRVLGSPDPVSELNEILGTKNVAFLAIHLNIDDSCKIQYKIEAKHTTPLNQQDTLLLIQTAVALLSKSGAGGANPQSNGKLAQALDGTATGLIIHSIAPNPTPTPTPTPSPTIGVWGGTLILSLPDLPASVTFSGALQGKVQADAGGHLVRSGFSVSNTCATATAGVAASGTTDANTGNSGPGAIPSSDPMVQNGKPHFLLADLSSIVEDKADKKNTAPANNGATAPSTGTADSPTFTATVLNEGLHHWDVSIGMPVTSYKDYQYQSDSQLVVPKKASDVKPYALLDLYPLAADLQLATQKTRFSFTPPKFSFGIPIGNQPFNSPFFGVGFGVLSKWIRFSPAVGIRYQKEFRTRTLALGATASPGQLKLDQYSKRVAKLQVMVTFSVNDARKVLGLAK